MIGLADTRNCPWLPCRRRLLRAGASSRPTRETGAIPPPDPLGDKTSLDAAAVALSASSRGTGAYVRGGRPR
jgi:hypothetical protein